MAENEDEKHMNRVGPIGERLLKLIRYYNMNMNSFSIRLQLPSNSIITRIVNDPSRGMSLDLIQKILNEFPELSPDWFIMDRGEMFKEREIVIKTETIVEPCKACPQKDETINNLKQIIEAKEQVIASKDELISTLKGR